MSSLHLVAAQSSGLVQVEFQRRIIHNMAEALLRQPSPPCLLRAPTGSGKTFMLAGVLAKVSAAQPTVWLWFVPFVNLTQQTEDSLLANAPGLTPVMLARGRNQEPVAGTVLLSTAQAVARAKDRKAGYAADGDDERTTLDEFVALARVRGLKIGLVVDEAHIGLDHGTEFGQFAHWLAPDYLVMASATPKDTRLDEFLAHSGKGAREAFGQPCRSGGSTSEQALRGSRGVRPAPRRIHYCRSGTHGVAAGMAATRLAQAAAASRWHRSNASVAGASGQWRQGGGKRPARTDAALQGAACGHRHPFGRCA